MRTSRKHKSRDRWLAILLTFVMLITIVPGRTLTSFADAIMGTFEFQVTDELSTPIEGATVTVKLGEEELGTGTTDENGNVSVEVSYVGSDENPLLSYTIVKDGYVQLSKEDAIDTATSWTQAFQETLTVIQDITEEDYVLGQMSWVYDAQQHEFVVTAQDFTVEYGEYDELNPSATVFDTTPLTIKDVGEKTIAVKLSRIGYNDLILAPITLSVTAADGGNFVFEKNTPQELSNLIFASGLTFENVASSTIEAVSVTYSFKDAAMDAIAQIDSNGIVSFLTPGTVTVVATMDPAQAGNYTTDTIEYTITAIDPATLISFTTSTEVVLSYGDNNNSYKNEVIFNEGLNGDDYQFYYEIISETRDNIAIESSDNVADIDEEGNVSIYSAGEVSIKLTLSKTGEEDIVLTYDLVVNRAELTDFTFDVEVPENLIYGDLFTNAANSLEAGTGNITYAIVTGDEYIRLVNAEAGIIEAIQPGTATVSATREADNRYEEKTITYNITVVKAEQTDFEFFFENQEDDDYKVAYGTETLTVITTVGSQSSGVVKYYIDGSTEIATINEDTGVITFISGQEGTFTVRAVKSGDAYYNDKEISCEVTVLNGRFDGTDYVQYQADLVGEDVWSTEDVIFTAAEGYLISRSDAFNAEWAESITISSVEENLQIYVRNADTQAISNAVLIGSVNVDKTTPTNLVIEYTPSSIVDIIIDQITFGRYENSLEVTITAVDLISGIHSFIYDIGEGPVVIYAHELQYDGNTASYSFEIEPFYKGNIHFTAVDNAGWSSSIDSESVIVDDDVPEVTITFDNDAVLNEMYYSDNRIATISIVEKDFHKENVSIIIGKGTTESNIVESVLDIEDVEFIFNSTSGAYEAIYEFTEDGYYTISVICTDTFGHEGNKSVSCFAIDKTMPIVSISYDDSDAVNGIYYANDKEVTITVVEHNFDFSAINSNSFVIVGKDADGNDINLSELSSFLEDEDNWTHNGDAHSITVPITVESNYDFDITYVDRAGNMSQNVTDVLTVDKTNPTIEVTYSNSVLGLILETITFGFYKASVEVTISASDEISGINQIVYSYIVEDGASSTNIGGSGSYINNDANGKNVSTTFSIDKQFRGKVSATAYDRAGNIVSMTDDEIIIVDQIAPGISVEYNDNGNGFTEGFYQNDRTAIIRICESNFFEESLYDSVANGVEQCLKITVTKVYNDGTIENVNLEPEFVATQTEDVYEATVTFTEEADYTFGIMFTDLSGNEAISYSKTFTIDKTAPVVSVSYDDNAPVNEKYFKNTRTATILVVEHNFDPNYVVSKINVTNSENDQNLNDSYVEYMQDANNWEKVANDTYLMEIVFDNDANYSFDVQCTDMAGNSNENTEGATIIDFGDSVSPREFTVDRTIPTANIQVGMWTESTNGTKWDHFIDKEDIRFNLSDNEAVTVRVNHSDNLSGIQEVKYYISDVAMSISEFDAETDWTEVNASSNDFEFVVEPEAFFVVYVYVKDIAGNELYLSSDGIILDSTLPEVEKFAPQVTITPTEQPVNGIYSDDVIIDLKVLDPKVGEELIYSGIKTITYNVYNNSISKTNPTQSGTLYTYSGSAQSQDDLMQIFERDAAITVDKTKNNSNDVVVEIIAIDNAGNVKTAKCNLKIDITKPEIEISYSNNDADSGDYFDADRMATIVITERNFSPNDVKVTITNTEGIIPSLSDWKKTEGTGNGDDTTWTATVTYNSDGDYSFDITAKDNAGLVADEASYVSGTVAPTEFTIDKIRPTISIAYDNNSVENGMYYKDDRTATIIINEHNFDPSRVTISLTATDDGTNINVPVISAWSSDGDRHVATIQYNADGVYTFDISVNDLAGNDATDFAEQTFCIDKTDPELNISGIVEFSANNGTVAPVIEYSDTNYDAELVSITLVGANRGTVELIGNYENIHNGRKFIFTDFATEEEVDDIYTLTVTIKDKAGREVSKTVNFSVNRFGSAYALDEATTSINGSYAKEPIDIVITEVNANELSNIKVTLFKNNKTISLVEGTDYSLEVTGGDGEWYQYVYTIFKNNFAEDGIYRLSIYSEDEAGNIADNTLDTKNMEINFGIDKSAPSIVVMDLESDETYDVDNKIVKLSVNDNLLLSSLVVFLDDVEVASWGQKEIESIISANSEFEFTIPGDTSDAHQIKIVCTDAAGNEAVTVVDNVRVTTDAWAQFVSNPIALYGSIAGIVVLLGMAVILTVYLRKRNK